MMAFVPQPSTRAILTDDVSKVKVYFWWSGSSLEGQHLGDAYFRM